MSPEAILIGLMAAPVAVLVLLQVNAALVLLSLCLGDVLVQFTSAEAVAIVSGAAKGVNLTQSIIKLGLLAAPAVLTTLFMIRTSKGKYRKVLNILPAAAAGMLTALLVVPLLPAGQSYAITGSALWRSIQGLQAAIVALGTLVCLLFLWLQRPKHHGGGDEKHGKHRK